ncbi:MAG: ShlB/FhaC/HecB family hemolysin secretion/activation protein [Acidobacteriota bacterium]
MMAVGCCIVGAATSAYAEQRVELGRGDYPPGAEKVSLPLRRLLVINTEDRESINLADIESARIAKGLKEGGAAIQNGFKTVREFLPGSAKSVATLTLKDLYLIRDAIARKLEENDYFLAKVIIPPQKIVTEDSLKAETSPPTNPPAQQLSSQERVELRPPPEGSRLVIETDDGLVRLQSPKKGKDKSKALAVQTARWQPPAQNPPEVTAESAPIADAPAAAPASVQTPPPNTACLVIVKGTIASNPAVVMNDKEPQSPGNTEKTISALLGNLQPIKTAFEEKVLRLNDLPGLAVETILTPPNSRGGARTRVSRSEVEGLCTIALAKFKSDDQSIQLVHISSLNDNRQPRPPDNRDPAIEETVDLTAVAERRLGRVFAGMDDRNNRYVGRWAFELGAELYLPPQNELLRGGRIEGRWKRSLESDRLMSFDGAADVWLNDFKTTASYDHSTSQPGAALRPLELDSVTDTAAIYESYAVSRGREMNVTLRGGFEVISTETTVAGYKLAEDRLRVARVGLTWDSVHPIRDIAKKFQMRDLTEYSFRNPLQVATMVDVEASRGLKLFGATDGDNLYASREFGRSDFTKLRLSLASVVKLLPQTLDGTSLYVAGTGQWTHEPLLVAEQFSLGGKDFGRAFAPAEYTGDHGAAGILELRQNIYPDLPIYNALIRETQPYVFVDAGRVWQKSGDTGIANATAGSWGVGCRMNLVSPWKPDWAYRINGTIDIQAATPLFRTETIQNGTGNGVHGFFLSSVRAEF